MYYAVKMEGNKYAHLTQEDLDVFVYSSDQLAYATFFKDLEEAQNTAKGVNGAKGSYFNFISEEKAVSVVEVIVAEGKIHELDEVK